ncbi:MAG: two-component system cell cycle response regulator [Psychrobacter glaciei]|jgi:two-component system cell cycle response regulator
MVSRLIKIVLVEDDHDDIYLFKNEVKKAFGNYATVDVRNSLSELMEIDRDATDIIMLDMGLPDSSGLNTVVQVLNQFNTIPTVVLTGLNSIDIGEQVVQLGAQDYIPKDELNYSLIARSIRFSIERHGLLNKVKDMAHVDSLTLLHNRAYFMDRLGQQCALSQRNTDSFGLIMVDLDRFKEVNDTYGHGAGDQVLEQFSARLKSSTRRSDVLARLGGDEFVMIVSPLMGSTGCDVIATTVLKCVSSPFLIFQGHRVVPVEIGVSVGCSVFPADGSTPNSLLSCADKAMYAVKNSGKNDYKLFSNLVEKP